MQVQPNLEKLKRAFYIAFKDCPAAENSILFQTIAEGKLLPSVSKRKEEFLQDFNKWLDGIDIRSVGQLIDALRGVKSPLPGWIKSKSFVIDYNGHGHLDLIRK